MSTSGLIDVGGDRSVERIVQYNLQATKTTGSWRNGPELDRNQLVSFHGNSNMPALSIPQRGRAFIRQSLAGMESSHRMAPSGYHHGDTQCHTIVQSFDYKANPSLTPIQVHAMGNALYSRIRNYFSHVYGYTLDNGLVSTHIDDDRETVNTHVSKDSRFRVSEPHLHNHIVIPSYNSQGESLYPYVRYANLYTFKRLNDGITASFGLNDYYFSKLRAMEYPSSSRTQYNASKGFSLSNVQRAARDVRQANDIAWDKVKPMHGSKLLPAQFKQARHYRNNILQQKFHFSFKHTKDTQTHKDRILFTAVDLVSRHNQRQAWYNLNNLHILQWRTRKEMKAERLIRQFDFSPQLCQKPVSYQAFSETVQGASDVMPVPINKIIVPAIRDNKACRSNLTSIYSRVEKINIKVKQESHNDKMKLEIKCGKALRQDFEVHYRPVDFNDEDLANRTSHIVDKAYVNRRRLKARRAAQNTTQQSSSGRNRSQQRQKGRQQGPQHTGPER